MADRTKLEWAERAEGLEDEIDALREELASALRLLSEVTSAEISIERAAWWMCANHRGFVRDHTDGAAYEAIIANATAHGPPPRTHTHWADWIEEPMSRDG